MARRRTISDEDLLAAARVEFAASGANASTRAIAARAGVSEAVLFQRFKTKAGLFFAALAPRPPDLERIFPAIARRPPRQALAGVAGRILGYFRSLFAVTLPLMSHPDFRPAALAVGNGNSPEHVLHAALAGYLGRVVEPRRLGRAEADAAALVIVATLHSLALYERIGLHAPRDAAAAIRGMIAVLWRGLAPRAQPRNTAKAMRGAKSP